MCVAGRVTLALSFWAQGTGVGEVRKEGRTAVLESMASMALSRRRDAAATEERKWPVLGFRRSEAIVNRNKNHLQDFL